MWNHKHLSDAVANPKEVPLTVLPQFVEIQTHWNYPKINIHHVGWLWCRNACHPPSPKPTQAMRRARGEAGTWRTTKCSHPWCYYQVTWEQTGFRKRIGEQALRLQPRHGFNPWLPMEAGEVWVLHPAGDSSQTWPGQQGRPTHRNPPCLSLSPQAKLGNISMLKDSSSNFSLPALLLYSFLISWWKARHGRLGRFSFKQKKERTLI